MLVLKQGKPALTVSICGLFGNKWHCVHVSVIGNVQAAFCIPKLPEFIFGNVPGDSIPIDIRSLFVAFKDVIYKGGCVPAVCRELGKEFLEKVFAGRVVGHGWCISNCLYVL